MTSTLNVINSSSEHQSLDTGVASLQQTDDSEALGLHIETKTDSAVADPNLMDFLKTEAAGSVYDTNPKATNGNQPAMLIASGITLAVLLVLVLMTLIKRVKILASK